jgi:predicted amino acid racemase
MDVTGITKACCGDPQIARAMLRGGVSSLGDSRVENLFRLRNSGISSKLWLIRAPTLSQTKNVVRLADVSLHSELPIISKLSENALQLNRQHKIVLMLEMGDLREGVCQEELAEVVASILEMKGVELFGIGMNLACLGGVKPTAEKMREFSRISSGIQETFGIEFKILSGGNSANIPLLLRKKASRHANHLRIGEAILLGCDSVMRKPIPGAHQDAFVLECEIIEVKKKPSVPQGELAQNAFGKRPCLQDLGTITRGLVAIGRQDVLVEGLTPIDPAISILGDSSDHIAVHLKTTKYRVGDTLKFRVNYGALTQLFVSPYVRKVMIQEPVGIERGGNQEAVI